MSEHSGRLPDNLCFTSHDKSHRNSMWSMCMWAAPNASQRHATSVFQATDSIVLAYKLLQPTMYSWGMDQTYICHTLFTSPSCSHPFDAKEHICQVVLESMGLQKAPQSLASQEEFPIPNQTSLPTHCNTIVWVSIIIYLHPWIFRPRWQNIVSSFHNLTYLGWLNRCRATPHKPSDGDRWWRLHSPCSLLELQHETRYSSHPTAVRELQNVVGRIDPQCVQANPMRDFLQGRPMVMG